MAFKCTPTAAAAGSKPTPGPLTLKRALLGDVAIVTKDRGIVAEFYTAIESAFERRDEEALANARLFLAAEDLLAVAIRMLDFARSGCAFGYPPGSLQELQEAVGAATAVSPRPAPEGRDIVFGHAWSEYLKARRRAILVMHADGTPSASIARQLNLEGGEHVDRLIAVAKASVSTGEPA